MCLRTREKNRNRGGFSVVELLVVLAVVGVVAVIVVPQLIRAYERSRQRVTLADLRSVAVANATYRTDFGEYAAALSDIESAFGTPLPDGDAWGNDWVYSRMAEDQYTVSSYGRDGAAGPAAPDPWTDEPFEADLIVTNGAFTQAPRQEQ
jgi:general secretion pathway protein G